MSVSSVTRGRDLCAVALGWTRPIARVDPHGGATLPPPREGGALGDLTAVRRCWGNPGRGAAIWGRGARPNGSASRSRFFPFHSHGTEPLRSELASRTGSSSSADRTRVWAQADLLIATAAPSSALTRVATSTPTLAHRNAGAKMFSCRENSSKSLQRSPRKCVRPGADGVQRWLCEARFRAEPAAQVADSPRRMIFPRVSFLRTRSSSSRFGTCTWIGIFTRLSSR